MNTLDFNRACRICLEEKDAEMRYPVDKEPLASKFQELTSIRVSESDRLPQNLCNSCSDDVIKWYDFKLRVMKSDEMLRQILREQKDVNIVNFEDVKGKDTVNELDCIEDVSKFQEVILSDSGEGSLREENADSVEEISSAADDTSQNHGEILVTSKREINRQDLPHTCKECNKDFSSYRNLIGHMRRHTNDRQYKCNQCSASFYANFELSRHVRRHTGERPFACKLCSRAFRLKSTLKKHINLHKIKLPHECSTCDVLFATSDELEAHVKDSHAPEETGEGFKCHICKITLKRKASLVRHVRIHDGVKSHSCTLCSKSFLEAGSLRKHMKCVHTLDKQYQCNDCDMKFHSKQHLILHTRKHTGERPYSCTVCPKSFKVKTHLKNHLRLHTGEDRVLTHKCDFCEEMFAIPYDLRVHLRKHTGEKPYQCEVCGKSFITSTHLHSHKQWHSNDGGEAQDETDSTNKCTVCQKTFSTAVGLRKHLVIHTGERPYKCDICGKSFNHSSYMGKHLRTHTGERKYVCDICGMAFTSNTTLWGHKLTHSEIKKHVCESCGKSFTSPFALKVHTRSHTGERPFKCLICDRGFVKNTLLRTHTKKVHPDVISAKL